MIYFLRYTAFVILLFTSLIATTPVCVFRFGNPKNNSVFFRIFNFLKKYLGGIDVHTQGVEIIKNVHPSVIIGNHQHNFDVLTVSDLFQGRTIVLGKDELKHIPIFGQIYVACGNLLVKRGNRKEAMKSMNELAQKINNRSLSVLVFPEGHRNRKKEMLPFKKGAYHTAIRTQAPIICFSAAQYVQHVNFNTFRKVKMFVKVHEPISTKGLTNDDIPLLIEKTRKVIADGIEELNQKYYLKEQKETSITQA